MNFHLIIIGFIEIILSALSGILIYFISLKVFSFLTKDINETEELKNNNIAVSILVSSFLFCIMLLIKESIGPSMETLSFTMISVNISLNNVGLAVLRILLMFLISAVFAFIFLWVSMIVFMLLTSKINEIQEIRKNNIAVSIIVGVLMLSLALIILNPLKTLLKGFVTGPIIAGGMKEPLIQAKTVILGLIQLGISIVAAICIFFYGFKLYDLLTRDINEVTELKSNNIAVSIQISAFIFSIMILVKAALVPSFDTLTRVIYQGVSAQLLLLSILKIVIFFILAAIFAFFILWLVMKGFMFINKNIDEMKEIKNNNIAVAIAIAVLLISASLLLQQGLTAFLSGLAEKAPEVMRIF
jgi:uncharacterized membrane protein YjfL (UPF0719 family)